MRISRGIQFIILSFCAPLFIVLALLIGLAVFVEDLHWKWFK